MLVSFKCVWCHVISPFNLFHPTFSPNNNLCKEMFLCIISIPIVFDKTFKFVRTRFGKTYVSFDNLNTRTCIQYLNMCSNNEMSKCMVNLTLQHFARRAQICQECNDQGPLWNPKFFYVDFHLQNIKQKLWHVKTMMIFLRMPTSMPWMVLRHSSPTISISIGLYYTSMQYWFSWYPIVVWSKSWLVHSAHFS